MATIDTRLVELLKKYGEDNTSVWDCHGTWVAYHAAVERMAAKAGIKFDRPEMIVNDPDKKTVVICVSASMEDQYEWSFGEVSPANNKNSYPYAMAEKRAKDRVALKLLGMAGLVYSEEEADDFKSSKQAEKLNETVQENKYIKEKLEEFKNPSKNEDTRKVYKYLQDDLQKLKSADDARRWWYDGDVVEQLSKLPKDWYNEMKNDWIFTGKRLAAHEEGKNIGDAVDDIVSKTGGKIVNETYTREQHPLEAGE